MYGRKKNTSIESFLVIVLMIIFATAVCVLIVQGSLMFDRAIKNKDHQENLRIAMSYISMSVKQNDRMGMIDLMPLNDASALRLTHSGDEEGLFTYIYYQEGILYEYYGQGLPEKDLATAIVTLDPVTFSYDKQSHMLTMTYTLVNEDRQDTVHQVISLRTVR